ncbi:MAG: WecB/TagA/CpsF family glycosyltransferase, partial [Patescibacteria group bacterium]|nr:WecB/TagA/CpsF family glycosyltransferase [Patescibacteria group bacterium]
MQSAQNNNSNGAGKINILGVKVAHISRSQALDKIQEFLADNERQYQIVTPNPEIILLGTQHDEEFWYILNHADLALPDGVALKIAGWFYGKNIERITGADLTLDILKLAQAEKRKVAVFSWNRGLSGAEEIKSAIMKKFPGIAVYVQAIERPLAEKAGGGAVESNTIPLTLPARVSQWQAGPFIKGVNQFAPEIVFCALGAPDQEKFIYYNLAKIPSAKL